MTDAPTNELTNVSTDQPPLHDQEGEATERFHVRHSDFPGQDFFEQIVEDANKMAESFRHESPPKRFWITFSGIIGIAFLITSLIFSINAFLSPTKKTKEKLDISSAFVGLDLTLAADNGEINRRLLEIVKFGNSPTQLADKEVHQSSDLLAELNHEFRWAGWKDNLPMFRRFIARKPWNVGFMEIKMEMPFLKAFENKRKTISSFLNRQKMIDMRPTYNLNDLGFGLKPENIDNIWVYVHLEEYKIGRSLCGMTLAQIETASAPEKKSKPDMKEALSSLFEIFNVAEIATRQKELHLRLQAASIRENAFDTLQMLVGYREFTRDDASKTLNILQHQLKVWDSDALAFAGEQTSGVWLYEVARKGKLLQALSTHDIEILQKLGTLSTVEAEIRRKINEDEIYYLKKMEIVLQSCDEEYYLRIKNIREIDDELDSLRGRAEYPILAGSILLRDIRPCMRIMAEDRARCEAWVVALSESLGMTPQEITVDPIRGKRYPVQRLPDPAKRWDNMISVQCFEDAPAIETPVFFVRSLKK
ncbi:MAG: hypothetical protein FWC50_13075 [Planctomycetaceae bacterium]|nr:hypothetical protein [Planctomycetaceae bacterium]